MKKKILFYLDSLNKGGMDKVVLDVVNNMDFDRYDITVMTRFPGGYYNSLLDKRVKVISNTVINARKHKKYNHVVRVLCDKMPRKMMYKLFVHDKYDVEIACGDAWAATLIGGSTNQSSKKILWEHMDVTKDESTATHFSPSKVEWFFGPFDKIVGVSRECKDQFVKKYGCESRVTYIYNPIDVDLIEKRAVEFEASEMDGEFNVLAMGRLVPQKSFLRLVNVVKRLHDKGLIFNLYIIGEGQEEEFLLKKIKEYNLQNQVKLLGFKENPYPYIKKADLFVCSSVHESYCLVVAESIVIGTPILSTRCTGPIELLDEGKYGMLVENTEEGLEKGLEELLTNNDLLLNYKKVLSKRKEFFDIDTCIKKFERLFEE